MGHYHRVADVDSLSDRDAVPADLHPIARPTDRLGHRESTMKAKYATELLLCASHGNRSAFDEIFPLLREELRTIARGHMRRDWTLLRLWRGRELEGLA